MRSGGDHAIVVVFNDEYQKTADLDVFKRGPEAFIEWLADAEGGGLLRYNIVIASPTNVEDTFSKFLKRKGRRLYIYMSGLGRWLKDGTISIGGRYRPRLSVQAYEEAARQAGSFDEVVVIADGVDAGTESYDHSEAPSFYRAGAPMGGAAFGAWTAGGLPDFTLAVVQGLRGGATDERGGVTSESLAAFLQNTVKVTYGVRSEGEIVFTPPRQSTDSQPPPRAPERVAAHADDPAVVDDLGRRPFAEVIGARIEEVRRHQDHRPSGDTDLGFMVHIHGPWGSGKTSVLNFLKRYLQDRRWVVVEFNAWRHQRMRPPWWMLIRTIYRDAKRQLGLARVVLWLRWSLWLFLADVVPVVIALALIVLAVFLVGDYENAPKVLTAIAAAAAAVWAYSRSLVFGSARAAQTYTELRSDPLGPIVKLFRKLIRAIRRPVVVFVDDLDRCDGKYVIELLEGIQTLFRSAPVTYVVAADRKWICSSFDQTYADFGKTIGEPGRPLGYLFLEKVFQVSASVPRLSDEVQRAYWSGLLQSGDGVDPRKLEEKRKAAEAEAEKKVSGARTQEELERKVAEESGDPIAQAAIRAAAAKQITTPEAQKVTEHRLQPFAPVLEPNPRAMKRLVNAYGLHQAAHFLEGRALAPEALARWTIIELRWPLLADYLAANPDAIALMGDGADASAMPEGLRPLFASHEVREVVTSTAIGKDVLDAAAIRGLTGR